MTPRGEFFDLGRCPIIVKGGFDSRTVRERRSVVVWAVVPIFAGSVFVEADPPGVDGAGGHGNAWRCRYFSRPRSRRRSNSLSWL